MIRSSTSPRSVIWPRLSGPQIVHSSSSVSLGNCSGTSEDSMKWRLAQSASNGLKYGLIVSSASGNAFPALTHVAAKSSVRREFRYSRSGGQTALNKGPTPVRHAAAGPHSSPLTQARIHSAAPSRMLLPAVCRVFLASSAERPQSTRPCVRKLLSTGISTLDATCAAAGASAPLSSAPFRTAYLKAAVAPAPSSEYSSITALSAAP